MNLAVATLLGVVSPTYAWNQKKLDPPTTQFDQKTALLLTKAINVVRDIHRHISTESFAADALVLLTSVYKRVVTKNLSKEECRSSLRLSFLTNLHLSLSHTSLERLSKSKAEIQANSEGHSGPVEMARINLGRLIEVVVGTGYSATKLRDNLWTPKRLSERTTRNVRARTVLGKRYSGDDQLFVIAYLLRDVLGYSQTSVDEILTFLTRRLKIRSPKKSIRLPR